MERSLRPKPLSTRTLENAKVTLPSYIIFWHPHHFIVITIFYHYLHHYHHCLSLFSSLSASLSPLSIIVLIIIFIITIIFVTTHVYHYLPHYLHHHLLLLLFIILIIIIIIIIIINVFIIIFFHHHLLRYHYRQLLQHTLLNVKDINIGSVQLHTINKIVKCTNKRILTIITNKNNKDNNISWIESDSTTSVPL